MLIIFLMLSIMRSNLSVNQQNDDEWKLRNIFQFFVGKQNPFSRLKVKMKEDARVRYTKMIIKECLLKLMAAKPIQKITVKELCEKAQINRATFYAHYRDPYDLLEQIENELFSDVSSTVVSTMDDIDELMKRVFMVIGNNYELCRILFSENGDRTFVKRVMDVSRDLTISSWRKQYPQATTQQIEYLYAFVVGGSGAVVEQWIRSEMKETPIELGEIAKHISNLWLKA